MYQFALNLCMLDRAGDDSNLVGRQPFHDGPSNEYLSLGNTKLENGRK